MKRINYTTFNDWSVSWERVSVGVTAGMVLLFSVLTAWM